MDNLMLDELIVCNGAKHFGLSSTVQCISDLFACGEVNFRILNSIRGKNITILQGFKKPNTYLMELLITIDAVRRAGAKEISVILPLMPFSRQDRKDASGKPISAKVVCDMLRCSNINRLITFDLHANQIQGFFPNNIQFDSIFMSAFWKFHLEQRFDNLKDFVFCSPDLGAVKRTTGLASKCNSYSVCFINKTRKITGKISSMELIGDVKNKNVILPDDMIDSGGTMIKAYEVLLDNGAKSVTMLATHGIFSGDAYNKLRNYQVITTNSCEINTENSFGVKLPKSIQVIDLRHFIMNIIHRINNNLMLSPIFHNWKE